VAPAIVGRQLIIAVKQVAKFLFAKRFAGVEFAVDHLEILGRLVDDAIIVAFENQFLVHKRSEFAECRLRMFRQKRRRHFKHINQDCFSVPFGNFVDYYWIHSSSWKILVTAALS